MGGGKSSKTSSSVTIPPAVLQRYTDVNNAAQATAATPFQQYSTDPSAFVAPLTGTQQAGIANTNNAVGTAQPYYDQATGQLLSAQNSAVPFYSQGQSDVQGAQTVGDLLGSASYGAIAGAQAGAQPYNAAAGSNYQSAYDSAQPYNLGATGLAIAGAAAVDPSQLNSQSINQYLSPYLGTVLQGTAGILNQQNQQQQAGQLGNAISQGAFGGDRAGVAAANLEQQQNLANSQIYSGILNQGYGQALSTAEGQQQLGLGAAQANRAALQNASTQIQGLGQQQYSQGMGLGQAQQGLGQQTYAQGANTASQLAALGQQQYGQGMGAAQQEAALGSGLYGMGSNTSQGLANLGTASQTAALQGAQAQLGAGQVEQQTQQAGDTALYNQFLQQQSYPFQVDQFLANIAEGTGALSGSTTTTTQPGGFFSDERLKENIRPVGKTFDGQKIYAYNYKGDKRTQVGLIAQEVEKKHPEAVGGHVGFKTVDYGVATDKSAARGKFADGGPAYDPSWSGILDNASYNPKRGLGMAQTDPGSSSEGGNGLPFSGATTGGGGGSSNSLNLQPLVQQAWDGINAGLVAKGEEPNSAQAPVIHWKSADGGRRGKAGGGLSLPGVDPNYIASLLQAQQQSYAPYSGGGLYGGQGGGSPRGGSSYVPSANLPVGQLAVSKVDPVAPQSGLSQIKQIADLGDMARKGASQLHGKNAGVDPDEMDKALVGMGELPIPIQSGGYYRGGLVPHKADGGMNDDDPIDTYSDPFGPKLKIPNDHPTAKLQTAQPPQQSGSSGLGDVLGIAKDVIPFLATGGRAGFADGGSPDQPFTPDTNGNPRTLAFLKQLLSTDYADNSAMPSSASSSGPQSVAPPGLGAAAPPPMVKPASPAAITAILAAEGTGKNPNSSARGAGQIIDSTFKNTFRQMFPDKAKGMSDGDILAMRNGPQADDLYKQMIPVIHGQNLSALGKAGLDATPGNAYLAWFLGPQGAVKTLKADPDTPMSNLVSKAAISANGRILNGKTAGQVADWATSLMHKKGAKSGGRINYDDGGVVPTDDELDADSAPLGTKKALKVVSDLLPVPRGAEDAYQPNAVVSSPRETYDTMGLGAANNNLPVAANEPDQEAYSTPSPNDPTNLLPAGLGAAQAPAHHGFFSGLGDRLAHPNGKPDLIVPILEGLAAMGTAPTRHLGVALAAGLGAGAHGYQQQKEYGQEQQRISQNQQLVNADVVGKTLGIQRFERRGANQWFDKVNGDVIDTPTYQRRLATMVNGIGSTNPNGASVSSLIQPPVPGNDTVTPSAPSAGTPPAALGATPPTNPSPPQQTAAHTSPVDKIYATVDKEPRIAQFRSQADTLSSQASDLIAKANDPALIGTPVAQGYLSQAEALRSQAQLALGQWSTLREQYAAPELAAYNNTRAQTIKIQQDSKSEAADQAKDATQAMNNANAAKSLLFDDKGNPLVAGGPLASRVGNLGAILEEAGISNPTVTALLGTNPNNQIELEKLKTTLGTEVARQQLQGSPIRVGEFNQFMKTVPSADIPSAAAKWLIDHTIVPQASVKLGAWDKVKDLDPSSDDVRGTLIDYGRKNPWFKSDTKPSTPAPNLVDQKLYRGKDGSIRKYDATTHSFVVP